MYQREQVYRIYVTDALKILGGLNERYIDVFKPVETRTAEEIINHIKAGLKKGGE